MATRDERLARAKEIVGSHDIAGLGYMIDDPLHPDDDTPVERFMLVTCTDHSSDSGDAWLEFVAGVDDLLQQIAHLMRDEWGLDGVWDLDAEDYTTPLAIEMTLAVRTDDADETHSHTMTV